MATLHHHPQVKALKQATEAAKHDFEQARGGFFPRVDVSSGYGFEAYSDASTRRNNKEHHYTDRTDATLTVTQMLWDGHGTSSRVNTADALAQSAKSQFVDGVESVGLDAVIAHLNVFRQQRLLELSEENVIQHQQILESMEERERLGAGSVADVTQTRGRLARSLTTLSVTESDVNVAVANYIRLTGAKPEELAEVTIPDVVPVNVDDAAAHTQANNPKIVALIAELEASGQRVEQAKASFYPTINLEGSSAYQENADATTTYTKNNQVRLTMDWNLYRGGSDVQAVKAASSRKRASQMALRDMRDSLMEEVAATWSQYKSAVEQVSLYEEAVEYNRQTRDMYQQQFNVGQRSLLDVLDAENELFNTQGQLVTAQMNVIIGAYRLIALQGGLRDAFGIAEDEYEKASELLDKQ